jgi:glycosyltransferase involved in cell wall biosynthesis
MMNAAPLPAPPAGAARPPPAHAGRPLITIAVPAYNRPALLAEALASVERQTVRVPLEVIVADDLGIPENRAVVERFDRGSHAYVPNPAPLGAVGNWNRCLELARGRWVMVLHEDDALYPWYLESVLSHLRGDTVAVCTLTSRGPVAPAARPPREAPGVMDYHPRHFLKSAMTPFPGVLVRRDVALRLGGFDETWGPVADYEFWYRLGCAGPVRVVRTVGAFYRVAAGQWTESVWGRMLGLTHLLRLRIAAEQFPAYPRAGRWLARFFTYRNARCYAARFAGRPAVLRRSLCLGRIGLAWLPSGWVWRALKLAARPGAAPPRGAAPARRARGFVRSSPISAPARVF